jgi:flagellar biosynthesis/type III secretory pathway protein FliH
VDQRGHEQRSGRRTLTAPSPSPTLRYEPPRLLSSGMGRVSHSAAEAAQLEAAREQGRTDALAELNATIVAHERARDEAARAARAFGLALDQLRLLDLSTINDFEAQSLDLAVAMAESLVGRELAATDDVVVDRARTAIALAPDRGTIVLRANPADVPQLELNLRSLAVGKSTPIRLAPDPSVELGGCVLVAGALEIDAQLSHAFERVREVFEQ